MRTLTLLILLTCILVVHVGSAYALRCGAKLVFKGDRKIEVLHKCGDPVSIDARTAYKVIHVPHKHHDIHREITIPIAIEEWIYNFGPRQFMRWLRFENGVLIKISTLDYGY